MKIPCYYEIGVTRAKPSLRESGTEGFCWHEECPACGMVSWFYNEAVPEILCYTDEGASKWPEVVKSMDTGGLAFCRSAMEQIMSDGLTGARFIPLRVSGPLGGSLSLPPQDYFALAADKDIKTDEDAAYGGLLRCSKCGVLKDSIPKRLIPVAESADGIDFCAINKFSRGNVRLRKFIWLVSWRVVKLIIRKKWKNVSISFIGGPSPQHMEPFWPPRIPPDYRIDERNMVSIDENELMS